MSELGTADSDQRLSEHRFLTIEFIDLVGFTNLAEQLDPEDLGLLLRRYQRLALTTMERFGGFVAQAFGDGLLVYFGYPAAHGNDAERALLAALALLVAAPAAASQGAAKPIGAVKAMRPRATSASSTPCSSTRSPAGACTASCSRSGSAPARPSCS